MSCNCNDCQDESPEEDLEDCFPDYTPLTWRDAEPANEVQAKAWGEIAYAIYDEYKAKAIPLPALAAIVCQKVNVRPENYSSLSLQVQRFLMESPLFEAHKGKNGGVFRKEPEAQPVAAIKLVKMLGVPDMITGKLEDDYTCGCGNTQLNKTEKSCWKCGVAIKS